MAWAEQVLGFWFGLEPAQWWTPDADLDALVRERFLELWENQAQRLPQDFLATPREALAAVILFDQMPRNMFRGHADSYATDHLALAIAREAIARGCDDRLDEGERFFLYMPFQHSEDVEDQVRSLALFGATGQPELVRYARLHHDVIARFGRFPHRNRLLGRPPRPEEVEAGDEVPW